MITYNNLYLDMRQSFRKAGIEAAALEARELLCYVTGKSQEELLADIHFYMSKDQEEQVRYLAERRLEGEPVAYLIGSWSFCGIDLEIDQNVLIPRVDTEVVAEQAIARTKAVEGQARVLDLCAGSGCIGLAVATFAKNSRVVLADVSEEAVNLCQRNLRRCGKRGTVTAFQTDATKAPPAQFGQFHVIVSNPPYIPTGDILGLDHSVRDYEPRLALDGGADGLSFYRIITKQWKKALRPGGWLIYEVGIGQAEQVKTMLSQEGFEQVASYPDTAGIQRVVEGRLPEEPEEMAQLEL